MNTNMTGFRWFSNMFASLVWMKVALVLEGFRVIVVWMINLYLTCLYLVSSRFMTQNTFRLIANIKYILP